MCIRDSYKTIWGLRLRAIGQHPVAAQSVGIHVNSMKYKAMIISGLIGGLAGAHLSLGYSALFTENMTNNRGFMGVAAMYFGGADPFKTTLGCLVFGFSDSVGARLQPYGLSSQIVLMMPYLVTVIVLAISMYARSVSYTHLDVYKRQVLENTILGFEPRKGSRIDFAKARENAMLYINPVSYTHLDVYKRQMYM